MNKVYMWEFPKSYPNKLIGSYDHDHSPRYLIFSDGKHLSKQQITSPPIIKFEVTKKELEKLDCLVSSASAPIINKRLADLLKEHAAYDIQLFDVKIECSDGDLEGYYILNVTSTIKGIDHAQSVYTKMKMVDHILSFKRLFYKPGCMGAHKLARDEEYKGHLLVNQLMYDLFQNHKITGVRLIEPDDYYRNLYR